MPQLIINHDPKISNMSALKAVAKFCTENYLDRDYKQSRVIKVDNGVILAVHESEHDNQVESPCSSVFNINRVEGK